MQIADIICPRQYNEALTLQNFFPCEQRYIQLDPAMLSILQRAEHVCLLPTLGGRGLWSILFARCFTVWENLNGNEHVFSAPGFLNLYGYYVDFWDTALNCCLATLGMLNGNDRWIFFSTFLHACFSASWDIQILLEILSTDMLEIKLTEKWYQGETG